MVARNSKGFYRGYANTIADADSKQRYTKSSHLLTAVIHTNYPREEWEDSTDMKNCNWKGKKICMIKFYKVTDK